EGALQGREGAGTGDAAAGAEPAAAATGSGATALGPVAGESAAHHHEDGWGAEAGRMGGRFVVEDPAAQPAAAVGPGPTPAAQRPPPPRPPPLPPRVFWRVRARPGPGGRPPTIWPAPPPPPPPPMTPALPWPPMAWFPSIVLLLTVTVQPAATPAPLLLSL